ncbi:MAG: 30S ribosomal protein S12 methylthiotransferase RimO [Pirellulaceae bacterium]
MSTDYQTPPDSPDYKGSYAFVSLGCAKNTVDSERMMGLLKLDGYQLVPDPAQSDFVIVNTCGFIEQARKESFAAIDEMLELKRSGKTRGVIVSGCLAERQKEQMLEDRPDIDNLVGVFSREEITGVVDRMLGDQTEQRTLFQPAPIRALPDTSRLRITPRHFAYLKISEGCDRLCTFCAIPKMRGKHATKPMERVLEEARELAASGVRELIVVAQDTTYYGMDLYGEPRLAELLTELDQVDGLEWIRLMYFYPMYIDQRLIETIAGAKRILPYIDMPLQHINDTMLRRMSRRVNRQQTEQIINDLRAGIPDLTLRTTMITGFPGETDQQFEELCAWVAEQRFERLGVFTYSFEPDTPSAQLPEHVDEATMRRRREQLMQIQQRVIFERNESHIGKTINCIIDQPVPDHAGAWAGRAIFDAPDVDGLVFVTQTEHDLKPGDIVDCEVVATQGYDLVAVAIAAPR